MKPKQTLTDPGHPGRLCLAKSILITIGWNATPGTLTVSKPVRSLPRGGECGIPILGIDWFGVKGDKLREVGRGARRWFTPEACSRFEKAGSLKKKQVFKGHSRSLWQVFLVDDGEGPLNVPPEHRPRAGEAALLVHQTQQWRDCGLLTSLLGGGVGSNCLGVPAETGTPEGGGSASDLKFSLRPASADQRWRASPWGRELLL